MLTLAAVAAIFVYGLMSPLLGVFLPAYALNAGQQGSLGLTNALGLVVASVSAGPLIDLKGTKTALVLGLGLIALALLCAPNAKNYSSLLTVYFVLGVGGGIVSTGSNSLVGDMSPNRRGPALNFLNLFFGLGGIVTTYAASYLLGPLSLCYSVAALTLLALLVNAGARIPKAIASSGFQTDQASGLLSNPTLILLSMLLFLYVACEVGVWNWLKSYLISIRFDPQTAGGIVSYGFALGILVGRVAVSRILTAVSAIRVLMVSSVLVAVTTFTMLHISSRTGVTIAVFGAGLAMSPVFPTALAMVGDHISSGRATALGLAITSGWLGLAVSSPIIGKLSDGSTLQKALLLLPALALAMVLVNLVLWARLRKVRAA